VKLSKTQRDVLQRMAAGAKAYAIESATVTITTFLTDHLFRITKRATIGALHAKGAIEIDQSNLRVSRYVLTDAGRKALEEAEDVQV